MSLTSYRAAPPRAGVVFRPAGPNGHAAGGARRAIVKEKVSDDDALGRPGSDLLSRVLRRSTIGAEGFDGRVRNGIGSSPLAIATRPAKRIVMGFETLVVFSCDARVRWTWTNESDQADRAISTGKLHVSPRFHTRPINVVVFHGSRGRPRFEVGFPLRCLQRLSRPYIATLQCGWRHNRSTRGTSIPVLSY